MARTRRLLRNERGMALALALFALALIGGMVAMNFTSALLEQQGGRNLLIATQAAEAAEGELWNLLAELEPSGPLGLPVGGPPLDLGSVPGQSGLIIQRQIVRLADNLFLVESRAAWQSGAEDQMAARSAGALARFSIDSISGSQTLLPLSRRPWLQLY